MIVPRLPRSSPSPTASLPASLPTGGTGRAVLYALSLSYKRDRRRHTLEETGDLDQSAAFPVTLSAGALRDPLLRDGRRAAGLGGPGFRSVVEDGRKGDEKKLLNCALLTSQREARGALRQKDSIPWITTTKRSGANATVYVGRGETNGYRGREGELAALLLENSSHGSYPSLSFEDATREGP
ncbi:hypothetical protein CMUS01_14538 [Colletotrichum musicola]|uniref:Uncharacterized protein n=1 Tax=Colletotrichum musicola TaxID=2175873 RepID=A0A8H6J410_9PEZI|nr:hypothetical protein CMUS01_14538 [Colletotrichum musicola]